MILIATPLKWQASCGWEKEKNAIDEPIRISEKFQYHLCPRHTKEYKDKETDQYPAYVKNLQYDFHSVPRIGPKNEKARTPSSCLT